MSTLTDEQLQAIDNKLDRYYDGDYVFGHDEAMLDMETMRGALSDRHQMAAERDALKKQITERDATIAELREKSKGRRCPATISTDPPSDCDAPFCGCNPEWSKCIGWLQESGWLSSSEAGKLHRELAELRKPVADAHCDDVLAEILRSIRIACPAWADVDVDTRNDLISKWRKLVERKPVAVERNEAVEIARAIITDPRNEFGLTRHAVAVLSAYDTIASNNAAWRRASDVWRAEMEGVRERMESAETLVSQCREYMKEGETPVQAIARNRMDAVLMMRYWQRALGERDTARNCLLQAQNDAMEINQKLTDSQESERRWRRAFESVDTYPEPGGSGSGLIPCDTIQQYIIAYRDAVIERAALAQPQGEQKECELCVKGFTDHICERCSPKESGNG